GDDDLWRAGRKTAHQGVTAGGGPRGQNARGPPPLGNTEGRSRGGVACGCVVGFSGGTPEFSPRGLVARGNYPPSPTAPRTGINPKPATKGFLIFRIELLILVGDLSAHRTPPSQGKMEERLSRTSKTLCEAVHTSSPRSRLRLAFSSPRPDNRERSVPMGSPS